MLCTILMPRSEGGYLVCTGELSSKVGSCRTVIERVTLRMTANIDYAASGIVSA